MTPRAAVLLVNLGTPTAPTPGAVRRYLRQFLSDRRVVELHPVVWRTILECFVLPIRARASARKYETVWLPEGSPLAVHTETLAAALHDRLGDAIEVAHAMSYGRPAVDDVLDSLHERGIHRVLVVPLYPQYSSTTTAPVLDAVHRHALRSRDQLELRTVRAFPADHRYIEALAVRIEEAWSVTGRPDFAAGDRLLLSFHGIPLSMVEDGDPYPQECRATAAALTQRLGLPDGACRITFQSKFGPAPWLQPATIDTVAELGAAGQRRLDVVCPGFVADCLETMEEIDQLNRETFVEAGGGEFNYIPCLNSTEPWVEALAGIVDDHVRDWGAVSRQADEAPTT